MKYKNKYLQISCDGGAATGKSTGAKMIAKKYNLKFLSSGLLYRYASYLILKYKPKMIGIYQLAMKSGSDNFRSSSILSIIERIKKHNIPMIIYEDQILDKSFNGVNIEKDLHIFKNSCDLIITNRITDDLSDVVDKVFTRDLFGYD